jgi:hypothetical protein
MRTTHEVGGVGTHLGTICDELPQPQCEAVCFCCPVGYEQWVRIQHVGQACLVRLDDGVVQLLLGPEAVQRTA